MSLVNLGLPFQEGDQSSNARRNATMVMSGRGSEIASIPSSQQIPLFRCITTESGLVMDEIYFRSADNLSVRNIRRKHTHSADTDEEGGLFHNILIDNPRIIVYGQGPSNNIEDFDITKLGDATLNYTPDATYGRIITLSSLWDLVNLTGNYVNASIVGQNIGFSEKMLAMVTIYMDHNANQVARVGFGMEMAHNTIDVTRKVGMEMCGGTGTNWQAVTADGITRSTSATSMNVAPIPNGYKTYRMFFNPNSVSYKLTNSDGVTKLMTSTIPSGGQIDHPRLFRLGLNTTNSTEKHMWIRKLMFIAKNVDATWFDSPE